MPLWFNWLVTDHFCHLALFIMLASLREFVMIFMGWSFVQSYCSLQFEKAWAYHVFLQGAGYPVLHHWVRSLQQRGLGQITADWDDGRQLTDDKWRMADDWLQLTADRQVPKRNSMESKSHITIIRTKTRPGEFFPNGSGSNQSLSLLVSVSLQPMIKGIETGSIQTTFPHQLDILSDNY